MNESEYKNTLFILSEKFEKLENISVGEREYYEDLISELKLDYIQNN